ncbi:hypothetical protein A9Q89_09125 [Gammaproteobacteria bacterium 53_120_T64]|nr:hypothetical protein A9Q89_09125 [Gammaproteobacteria bacterium 53_120_T64]
MNTHPVVAAATALQPLITEYRREAEETSRLNLAVVETAGKAGRLQLNAKGTRVGFQYSAGRVLLGGQAMDPASKPR